MELRGILPPVATPFDRAGEVDYVALTNNLKRWNQTDLSGYAIIGSTSETVYLSDAERVRILETAREIIPRDRIMISGVIYESTRQAVAFTKTAAAAGVNYVLVGVPNYYKDRMTEPVLHAFYSEVADHSPVPVLLYNVPQFTGVPLPPSLVAKLSEHPNIVGMKDSSGNIIGLAEILRRTVKPFPVLVGAAMALMPSLALGAVGGIIGISHVAPQQCVALLRAFESGDIARARALQFQLAPAMVTTGAYGIPGVKAAMDMVGYVGGYCRPPLQSVDAAARAAIQSALQESKLI